MSNVKTLNIYPEGLTIFKIFNKKRRIFNIFVVNIIIDNIIISNLFYIPQRLKDLFVYKFK